MSVQLRRLDTAKGLTPAESEVVNHNWWVIESALNSVGALPPTPQGTPSPPIFVSPSDLTGYLLLVGRLGGQIILSTDINDVPVSIKGISGQVGFLQEWIKSDNTILSKVDKDGIIYAPRFSANGNGSDYLLDLNVSGGQKILVTPSGDMISYAGGYANQNGGFGTYFRENGFNKVSFYSISAGPSYKELILSLSGLTDATTRTWTVQDITGTVIVTGGIDLPIADGGTGQSTAILGFNALSPITTRGDLITRDATNNIRLGIGTSGKYLRSDGTDPSWQTIVLADITNGNHVVLDNAGATVTATWNINCDSGGNLVLETVDPTTVAWLNFTDLTTGNTLTLLADGPITADGSVTIPAAGGVIVTTLGVGQVLGGGKLLAVDAILRATTSSSGVSFTDTSVGTKKLRFVLSGAVGNNSITLTNTALRNYTLPDYEGTAVIVGNQTAAAGKLGKSDLTAQTGNIAAVTLLTSSANSSGRVRVSFYIKTTTAGAAGDLIKITVAFNDGSAQTIDVPLQPIVAAAPVLNQTHDCATLNAASFGHIEVYAAASTAITYTTTFTVKTGSPQYTIRGRIEHLV